MSFTSMVSIIPEASLGIATTRHVEIGKDDAIWSSVLSRLPLIPGKFVQLFVNGKLMMSDTENERQTNQEVCRMAHGNVLIAGLGIGMVLTKILEKPEVSRVTVIEKHKDVIDLIGPHFSSDKLIIVHADIYDWKPTKGMRYDCIYFDIWASQSTDDLEDMARLHRRFQTYKASGGWMESWNRGYLRMWKRRGR